MFTGARFVQTEAEHRLRELLCNGAIRRHHVIIGTGKEKQSGNVLETRGITALQKTFLEK